MIRGVSMHRRLDYHLAQLREGGAQTASADLLPQARHTRPVLTAWLVLPGSNRGAMPSISRVELIARQPWSAQAGAVRSGAAWRESR